MLDNNSLEKYRQYLEKKVEKILRELPREEETPQLKVAIQDLKKSVDELRTISETLLGRGQAARFLLHLKDAVVAVNREYIITVWNKGAEKLYGWKAEEVVGKPIHGILVGEFMNTYRSEIRLILEEKGEDTRERINISKDGRVIPVEVSTSALYDSEGKIDGFVGVHRDLTNRKETQEHIKRAHDFYHGLLENFPAFIWQFNKEGRCSYVNKTWLGFAGRSLDQELGDGWLGGIHEKDRARFQKAIKEGLKTEKSFKIQYRIARYDGVYRWLVSYAQPFYDPEQGFTGFVGSSFDLTERKVLENKLRENSAKLKEAQRIAHIGSWTWDTGLNIVTWSDELFRIYGFKPQEFEATYERFLERVHPEDRKRVHNIIQDSYRTLEPFDFEHRILLTDGTTRYLRGRGEVVIGESSTQVRMFATGQDITDRKQIEESLKTQAAILEHMAEGVVMADGAGVIVFANHAMESMFGYEQGELIGKPTWLLSAYGPEEDFKNISRILSIVEEKGIWCGELFNRKKDGAPFYTQTTISYINLGGEKFSVAIQEDVSELKLAEEKLQQSRALQVQLAAIVESSNDAIVSQDLDGKILSWNSGAEYLYGYRAEEAIGKKVSIIIPESQKNEFSHIIERIKKGENLRHYHTIRLHKNGKNIHVSLTLSPLKDNEGKFVGVSSIGRDITERKKLEARLEEYTRELELKVHERTRELEKRLIGEQKEKALDEALLESIGEAVIAVDEEARIMFLNAKAERLVNCSSEEAMGKLISEVLLLEDERGSSVPHEDRVIVKAVRHGKKFSTPIEKTFYSIRKDGSKIPVAVSASPVILDGKIVGAIGIVRDVSKEKEIEHAKNEFVSLASHQLRTPLSTVHWYVETLLAGRLVIVDKNERRYLEQIYSANQRMIRLVNSLLNVSRIELGTLPYDPEPLNIAELAKDVIKELRPQIREKQLSIETQFGKQIPPLNMDPNLTRIIFQNLLSNAVKYTDHGGKVQLSIRVPEEDNLLIEIDDTGCGIPENSHNKVFSKFFRGENVIKTDQDGTGLGLYLVKSIVDLMGGKIRFNSEEGKGTSFSISFPMGALKAVF